MHRPRSRDDGGVLVCDAERVEVVFDEVDKDVKAAAPSVALGWN